MGAQSEGLNHPSLPMNHPYKLIVTPEKNGTFDHRVVEVATGNVVGARNSRRRYRAAAVVRERIAVARASAHNAVTHTERQLDEYRAVVASGVVPAEFRLLTVDNYREFIANGVAELPRLRERAADLDAKMLRGEQFQAFVAGFSGTYAGAAKLARNAWCQLLGVATE